MVPGALTYRMVGTELEGVWRKNGNSEEPQEHKATDSRVLNMWVTCREMQHVNKRILASQSNYQKLNTCCST